MNLSFLCLGLTLEQTFRNFKPFTSSLEAIYLVEASPTLREVQKRLLCGDAAMEETEIGHRSTSKYFDVPVVWVEDIRLLPHGKYLSVTGECRLLIRMYRGKQDTIHIRA